MADTLGTLGGWSLSWANSLRPRHPQGIKIKSHRWCGEQNMDATWMTAKQIENSALKVFNKTMIRKEKSNPGGWPWGQPYLSGGVGVARVRRSMKRGIRCGGGDSSSARFGGWEIWRLGPTRRKPIWERPQAPHCRNGSNRNQLGAPLPCVFVGNALKPNRTSASLRLETGQFLCAVNKCHDSQASERVTSLSLQNTLPHTLCHLYLPSWPQPTFQVG